MTHGKRSARHLSGKCIDVHSHIGVSLKAYGRMEYPYAQSIEGLRYRQKSAGVDVNVVFPFSPDLHFDCRALMDSGDIKTAADPVSVAPYAVENRLLMREVFDYCPELSDRFLPFVSVDPGREVAEQMRELTSLEKEYPIYGIKVVGVACQSNVKNLLSGGSAFLGFAEERGIPVLFHTTATSDDEYSNAADALTVVEARPAVRFCLAHGILFHKGYLERVARLPNAWVDTAAMKIQVDLVNECIGTMLRREDLIDADFTDYRKVMRRLCEMYPRKVLWGTDSPAYSYICTRKQGEGKLMRFRYKGTYEQEVAALRSVSRAHRRLICSSNTVRFLFGD